MRALSLLLLLASPAMWGQAASDNLWMDRGGEEELRLTAGMMTLSLPVYPGASEARSTPYPVFNGDYQDRLVFGASRFGLGGRLGVNAWAEEGFHWAVGVESGEARPESQAAAWAGLGSRPAPFFLGTALEWSEGPLLVHLGLRQGASEEPGRGAVARVCLYLPLGHRWLVEVMVQGVAFDATQMGYEYGITPDQARERQALVQAGDPRLSAAEARVYAPGGGIAQSLMGLTLACALDRHWRMGLSAHRSQVLGPARPSPLVREVEGWVYGLGWAYQL